MLEILIATNNEHKLKEFNDIFKDYEVKLYSLNDLNLNINVDENGKTFYENALIKCNALKKYTSMPIIADDSGIIIDGLGDNFPGIHSHRYMEEKGGQAKCLDYLTKNYLGHKAKFHCSIVLVNLLSEPVEFVGEVSGTISKIVKNAPFGYDPIFKLDSINKTFSELTSKEKDKMSHRYLASIKLLDFLKTNHYI